MSSRDPPRSRHPPLSLYPLTVRERTERLNARSEGLPPPVSPDEGRSDQGLQSTPPSSVTKEHSLIATLASIPGVPIIEFEDEDAEGETGPQTGKDCVRYCTRQLTNLHIPNSWWRYTINRDTTHFTWRPSDFPTGFLCPIKPNSPIAVTCLPTHFEGPLARAAIPPRGERDA